MSSNLRVLTLFLLAVVSMISPKILHDLRITEEGQIVLVGMLTGVWIWCFLVGYRNRRHKAIYSLALLLVPFVMCLPGWLIIYYVTCSGIVPGFCNGPIP